jgi:hypothetical protein
MTARSVRREGKASAFPSPCALLLFLLVCAVFASARADADKTPQFTVSTADGKSFKGPLSELTPDWGVRLGDQRVAGTNVLSLRRTGQVLPPMPEGKHILLANGDRIPVAGPRLEGERFHFRHPDLADGKETSLPLAAVSVLWLAAPDRAEAESRQRLRYRLTHETRSRDQVLLRNGDTLEGVFSGLDAKKVEIEVEKKVVAVNLAQVAAVALSTDLADTLRPKGVYGHVVLLADDESLGGRLSLSAAECKDGKTLQATTVFGASLTVPLDRVAALDLYRGRAVYLSDLKPSKYEHTPYLDCKWPYVADGSVAGCELRLAGSAYDKGIGLHSQSRLSYELGGAFQRFEATVGLDDQTGRRGSVRVKVLADGKPLDIGPDRELTASAGPLSVNVSVAGVKELTLVVEFGRGADVEDHVDWVDARLVK